MHTTEMARRTDLDVHPLISERYSLRSFSDRDITEGELELVLEAARLAPSSMNEQPWRFLVVRKGGEGHALMLESLMESNRVWADKAPVLIMNMVHRTFARNGQVNAHAWHDLGLAIAQLTAQATALGMGLHQLGGFHPAVARDAFDIPEDLDVVSVTALGFPGDADQLPENLRQRELTRSPRRPLSEVAWRGKVGG